MAMWNSPTNASGWVLTPASIGRLWKRTTVHRRWSVPETWPLPLTGGAMERCSTYSTAAPLQHLRFPLEWTLQYRFTFLKVFPLMQPPSLETYYSRQLKWDLVLGHVVPMMFASTPTSSNGIGTKCPGSKMCCKEMSRNEEHLYEIWALFSNTVVNW